MDVDSADTDRTPKDNKITSSVLDAFDLLKAVKDDVKLNGGAKIVSLLQGTESEKDIKYVLKRLVRSLGANVPGLRVGYFATLVALLTKFNDITIAHLLYLVKKELHPNKSSKSEVGDTALGHILVCSAVFRSGLILKATDVEKKEIIDLLLSASKKKSYLSTVAYLVLLDFVKGLDEQQFASLWSNIKPEFNKEVKDHNLDSLYFLMEVSIKFPASVKLKKLLGVSDILCEDNIHTICEKIMAGIDYSSLNHPIFNKIGTLIADSPHLHLFWTSGVDSQLTKHNRNRELVAINLLTTILNNIKENTQLIPDLLSKNFFKLFLDWFKGLQTASKIRSKRDNEDDNKIMIKKEKELLNSLAKALKSDKVDGKIRVEVLKKLLFNPGEINFSEITGTSIVKSIISDLNKDGVMKMAKLFKGVLFNTSKKFVKEDVERNWYNNERLKAADMLSYLVSHDSVKDDTEFKLSYMKLLMCFGFFKIGGDDNVAISAELSGSIKTSFYRCFTTRFSNVYTLVGVLSALSKFINSNLEKDQVRAKLEKQFPPENMECWKMLVDICKNIEKNPSKSKIDNVFLILLYQLGLFLFSEPTHVKMSRSSIKELKSCYEHYKKGKKKKPKKIKDGDLADDEPEWIEVLVEVLLSILSTDSSVLRSVVQCVFRLLWEYLTPSSIGQIMSVLDPDNESNPLTQDSDSEGEEETSDNEEENGEKSSSGEESEESDGNDNDVEDIKIPEQLRLAVQKALGSAALESDAESLDADMIDDEEGQKLDEALAEAFRQFHQGKTGKSKKDRKNKKTLSDFRIRVLDLIDIYLEKDPSMDICLGMIAPLMRCLEFCIQDSQFSELENRVRKTIKNLTKVRKFSSTDDVTIDILCDYLQSVIDKGARSHFIFQALGDTITFFATFIINCSQKILPKNTKSPKKGSSRAPLVEIFKDALQNYFQNRNCLLPIIFFHSVLQTEWEGTFDLVPIITSNIFNSNVRQFRRNEGLELMIGFYRALKRNKALVEKLGDKLTNIESEFEKTLSNTLNDDSEFECKTNFLVQLKKLINIMRMFHEGCKVQSGLNYKHLLNIVGSRKGAVKPKNNIQETEQTQIKSKKKTKQTKKKRKAELTTGQVNGHSEPQKKKVKISSANANGEA